MAAYKKRRRKKKYPLAVSIIIIVLAIAYMLLDYFGYSIEDMLRPKREPVEGEIRVHVIDVGQADCILIDTPDGCMLIDTGIDESESHLENYLYSLGITEIDYLLITHAHLDHYGGADMILEEFEVENIIYDNYEYSATLINMFKGSGANIIDTKVGDKYYLGEAEFTVFCADMVDPANKNDYSIVIRLDYGESSFVFTGDATKVSEAVMLETLSYYELDCDFLKSGHHGSASSSSADYLAALTPDIVAISCGEGNTYGHPTKAALDRYEDVGAEVYRTDLSGDLVFVSNGETITYIGDIGNIE